MMTAMRFRHEINYAAAPDEVFAMLRDPAYREKVGQAQNVAAIKVTVTPDGDGFELVNDQMQRTAGLPAIAKKIAGDTTNAVITEKWAGPSSGTVSIVAPGKPTSASGTITLAADGAGTKQTVDLDIKVKVPLIAGKLESIMADQIGAGYVVEAEVGTAWLKGER